jgi:Ca-activated chloride channel family protein
VTLRYSELLESSDGLLQWQVPLRASSYSTRPIEKVRLTAFIQQDQPLASIYSPTHSVTTEKHTEQSATVRLESNQTVPKSNFRLLLSTGKHTQLADWLAYHPAPEEPGYFLMLFHPDQAAFADPKLAEAAKVPKDVVLLLDKSGSMRGAKIDQARQALLEVLEDLAPEDRFGIVVYDQAASTFRPALVEKSDASSLESARGYIRSLGASGSTNMEMGLRDALAMLEKSDRPSYLVHLSDGVPTIGQRDPRKIAAQALQWNSRKVRMFSFGVGHDVNSRLLNQLSRDGRGKTYFVAPEEPIEASVSALSQRLGQPALSDIRWELRDAAGKVLTLSEVEPAQIYDLFQGDQATIVGRYQGTGQVQLVVRGNVAGENKEWTEPIELSLPQRSQENAFIASLWASRRVASLIDEIDLEGQTPERVKLLVELAKRYGILTEYTAFLADESAPGATPVDRESRVVEELKRLGEESGQMGFQQRAGNRKSIEANNLSDALAAQSSSLQRGLAARSASGRPPGGPAGGIASGLGGLPLPGAPSAPPPTDAAAPNRVTDAPSLPIVQSGDRAFFQKDGQWVDSQLIDQLPKQWTSIARFSEPYFQLLSRHRDALEGVLEVELPVLVRLDGMVYRIE